MSSFTTLSWLRELRDRNAEEEKGMSINDRLEKHRREARDLVHEFLKIHPNAGNNAELQRHAMVAEKHHPYGEK